MPLDHGSDPGKNEIKVIGSLAKGSRRARRNPTRPAGLANTSVLELESDVVEVLEWSGGEVCAWEV
jgi:hypothetical protein